MNILSRSSKLVSLQAEQSSIAHSMHLLSSKRSSLSLYRSRDVRGLTEKQPVSLSLGVLRHEVAQTDLPRKNLNERTSAYLIERSCKLMSFRSGFFFIRMANEALEVKKVVCWHALFFFLIFLLMAVRSGQKPICRKLIGISSDT